MRTLATAGTTQVELDRSVGTTRASTLAQSEFRHHCPTSNSNYDRRIVTSGQKQPTSEPQITRLKVLF